MAKNGTSLKAYSDYVDRHFPDNNGDPTGEADAGRHRGAARRHHQAGDFHPRAPRHVHGHGDASREPGQTLHNAFLLIYRFTGTAVVAGNQSFVATNIIKRVVS